MYESNLCEKCYGCSYCTRCFNSTNCVMGFDLRDCLDCVMCVGLRSKQYCILNKQYTKEEYEKKKKEMELGNRDSIRDYLKKFKEFILQHPHKYASIIKSVSSTGDMLVNCKMSKDCFYFNDLENCRFMVMNDGAKDCYDCNNTGKPSLCYEGATPDNSYGCIATIFSWKCNKIEYSNNCHSSSNLFGCSALRTSEYVILNKKYSKEKYLELREKIIAHMKETKEWGEFFPNTFSPFGYNETSAHDWFPLSKKEALAQGYKWKDQEIRNYQINLSTEEVPKTITNIEDSIIDQVIGCEHSGKCAEKCTTAFRVTLPEVNIYRKLNIPLPTMCPNCRFYQRLKDINPPWLWHRTCMCDKQNHSHGVAKCEVEFETSYAPERPEIVYCEKCYQREVY